MSVITKFNRKIEQIKQRYKYCLDHPYCGCNNKMEEMDVELKGYGLKIKSEKIINKPTKIPSWTYTPDKYKVSVVKLESKEYQK